MTNFVRVFIKNKMLIVKAMELVKTTRTEEMEEIGEEEGNQVDQF